MWFALFAALRIAIEPGAAEWRRGDSLVLAGAALCAAFPAAWSAAAGLVALGVYLAATARDRRSSRIALVLLALSGPLLWGRMVLSAFSPVLLAIDGHLVGLLAGTGAQGNLVGFVGGGHFVIGGPCSSVHNMSLALLLWTCVVALLNLQIDRRLLLAGGAAIVAMFVLNVVRLVAIAVFPAHFELLHVGAGAVAFGWIGLLVAGLIIGIGAYDALARRN